MTDCQAEDKKRDTSIYRDEWQDGILYYRGEGQVGDQKLTHGNDWIANASERDVALHLFEVHARSLFTYRGRVELVAKPYRRKEPDKNGDPRSVLVFPLTLVDTALPPQVEHCLPVAPSLRVLAPIIPDDEDAVAASAEEERTHSRIQHVLLQLGSMMEYELWVANNDRSTVVDGQRLGDIPLVRDSLPVVFDPDTMRTIKHIDVLWLKGARIVAAFEIEHTTAVYSGLLRMSDLIAAYGRMLHIPLYIVAPDEREQKVRDEICRPTFLVLEPPLHEVCRYISYSKLLDRFEKIGDFLPGVDAGMLLNISSAVEPSYRGPKDAVM